LIEVVPAASSETVPRYTFSRSEHLKSGDEIKKAFARGRKISSSGAKLFYLENGMKVNRVAFTFPRKYGNAVERNRSRRLSREAYRLTKPRMKGGFDLVILVYPGGDNYQRRVHQLDSLFVKAGLITDVT
jgi:ribonuclease P protein component